MMRSAWSVYGLLVLASVAYCPMLFSGLDRWGRGDWDQFSFRFETPRTAILRDRQLPLWNPYVNGGNVLLAHPHCPAFSPWYVTTLVLGAPLALRVNVVLFMALGAVGMASLLRRWQVSPAGCMAGGVLLMMSAHFAMHITEGHLEWCVMGLMPWVLLCLIRAGTASSLPGTQWRFVVYGAMVLASAVLYGSIYIVVIFVPLFCVWAGLESLRTRSGRMVLGSIATMGLTFLLCAVALFPRMEFLRANPRKTERHEQLAPAALGRMLLDPDQAGLYRATRDLRNPRTDELARILPWPSGKPRPYETLKWHRLEVTLATTSAWAAVTLGEFPHLWFYDELDAADLGREGQTTAKTPARLNALPHSKGDLQVRGPQRGGKLVTGEATAYVQLPEQGPLKLIIHQGFLGATKLTVTYQGRVVLDAVHSATARSVSSKTCFLPREAILGTRDSGLGARDLPWYRLEAMLTTSSDWCRVEMINCPYLFRVESPQEEAENPVPLEVTALDIGGHPPPEPRAPSPESRAPSPESRVSRRASLYVRPPENDEVRVAVTQGPTGTTTLTFSTPQGTPLSTIRTEKVHPNGVKTYDYVLSGKAIRQQLTPRPAPWRWRLDEWGMTRDWHEYGCYVTWLGLAMAVLGLLVSYRRQWPLAATGLLAGLIALGAGLPLNFWAVWKLLPMYGSLQVPSRFLAAVVFVIAAGAGFGVDRLGRWAERIGGVWLGRSLQAGIVLAVYLELAALGWNLFSEIFVCPKRNPPARESRESRVESRESKAFDSRLSTLDSFAQRFAADEIRYAAMYSAHYPYLRDNAGVLREYENIAVPRGKIRLTSDQDYRGEVYLQGLHGKARIDDWSMSRVTVALELDASTPGQLGRLVLNQNYFPGWKAIRRSADGTSKRLPAEANSDGLVSVAVGIGDCEVEFYYLPDSFLWGAGVSGLTLLGCLGLLCAGSRGSWRSWPLTRLAETTARRVGPVVQSGVFCYLVGAVVLNLPFLLCHPGRTLIDWPFVRSLAVSGVLFLAPGLPVVGLMIGRGWLPRFGLLWVMAGSLAVFVALLSLTHLAGLPVGGGAFWNVWNGTWIVTNLALLLNVLAGGPPGCGIRLQGKSVWIGVLMFAIAYLMFFHAATRVVPVMDDHDYETQGTASGLLSRLRMTLLTDRSTDYCYAHPPFTHLYVAGSFLYYGQADELAYYDDAWNRVRVAKPDDRDSVREKEVQMLYDQFRRNAHHRLPTRTPNVFLAAITVGLLAWWIAQMTGYGWLGLLVPLAYATNPEVFVRSSYGGYFAISQFALVQILLAVERFRKDRSRAAWAACFLSGGFAALANHKLLLLPLALVVWGLLRIGSELTPKRAVKAVLHPVLLGFAAGWAMFWVYGLAVSPSVFLQEHFHHHLVDRITHVNPLGYGLYPTVPGLWLEFWQHTGYLLLPLGIVALAALCRTLGGKGDRSNLPERPGGCFAQIGPVPFSGWRGTAGLWALWVLLSAAAFSVIDWRQTKHLMPLLLPLSLAPARWAASQRIILIVVSVAFAALLAWNLVTLRSLTADFHAFPITPAW